MPGVVGAFALSVVFPTVIRKTPNKYKESNMSTEEFINNHQLGHPIVYGIYYSLLKPILPIVYLDNYNYEKFGPVEYAKKGDACFDLRSCTKGLIPKDSIIMIPLGIKVAVPPPFVMKLYMRSGQAKNKGIILANGTGIIDQGFRGEVQALIKNISGHEVYINYGERVVQASLELSPQASFEERQELPASERGEGGFGHTGL